MKASEEVWIDGVPVPKARPRVTKSGHAYTPERTREYERRVREAWLEEGGFHSGPVRLRVEAVLPIPRSWPKWKQEAARRGEIYPETRPDVDNIVKAVQDALNGVAYRDDCNVIKLITSKEYGDHPGVLIELREL